MSDIETALATPETSAVDAIADASPATPPTHAEAKESSDKAMRDELIAAAKAADIKEDKPGLKKAKKKDEHEEAPSAAAEAAGEVAEVAPQKTGVPRLAQILRGRAEKRKADEAVQERVRQEASKFDQHRFQLEARARELEVREKAAAEQMARVERFKEDPIQGLKEFGIKPEDHVQNVIKHGSKEWQMEQAFKAKLAELDGHKTRFEALQKQQEEAFQRAQSEQQQAAIRKTEVDFLATTANRETYPTFAKLPGSVRLPLGYSVAKEYNERTGNVASDSEIAEYLESVLSSKDEAPDAPQSVAGNGIAPKSKANGPRTLSKSVASERRASQKPTSDMSREELRQVMIEDANEARRSAV